MCTICFLLSRTADKESLTTELTKLQQSYRHVKGELASKIEQLTQNEANRRSAEEKIRQLNIHQNSVVRVFILLFLHVFSFSSLDPPLWGARMVQYSIRLPLLMWPGFDSRSRHHAWVEFVVGSCPCSDRFFFRYSGFSLSSEINISKSQFDL